MIHAFTLCLQEPFFIRFFPLFIAFTDVIYTRISKNCRKNSRANRFIFQITSHRTLNFIRHFTQPIAQARPIWCLHLPSIVYSDATDRMGYRKLAELAPSCSSSNIIKASALYYHDNYVLIVNLWYLTNSRMFLK